MLNLSLNGRGGIDGAAIALPARRHGMRQHDIGHHAVEACDRTVAPETAPPNGLFLMKVFYTPEERAGFKLENVPFY